MTDKKGELELIGEFIAGLPVVLHDIAIDFPPMCTVRARPGVVLMIPAPGVDGTVVSYIEPGDDGRPRIGVLAPLTIPHPDLGWGSCKPGEMIRGECFTDDLVVVSSQIARETIALAIDLDYIVRRRGAV